MKPSPSPPSTICHSVPPRFRPPCAPHQIHKNPDPKSHSSSSSFSFVVELRLPSSDLRHRLSLPSFPSILSLSSLPQPQFQDTNPRGSVFAVLFYREFSDALDAVVSLWRHRFNNSIRTLCPSLVSSVLSSSQEDQLHESLKTVFLEHIEALQDGDEVNNVQNELTQIDAELHKLDGLMRKRGLLMRLFYELQGKQSGLMEERRAIVKRLKEFMAAMNCIRAYLEGKRVFSENEAGKGFWVFRFDGGKRIDWIRVHQLMCRERRRLKDGLPIYAHREEILRGIELEQVTVLIGETGSGKSTQLVQYLADSGVAAGGAIVCTQPRKIAALSLAERVKEECAGCYVENSISCLPTFSTSHCIKSKVSYMTDNCLLQHYMHDKNLSGVSCILVDEAHERSLNTDLLLAMLKKLLSRKASLRLVIMSATADAEQLASYFYGCQILHVVGRSFPVDIKYVPFYGEGSSSPDIVASYVSEVVKLARRIHEKEKEGTILAFLTSQVEVEWACDNFTKACDNIKALLATVLPLHGKLSHEEQFRVFNNYAGKRKVIFATNVAETSLTIPGVKYVIDSGLVKESKFEPATGMNVLRVCSVSQSSANQRAGRAGRTEPGQCYRLYEESHFMTMAPNQEPEIRRVHLGVAVLRILALGIKNIQDFDFVDAPSKQSIDMAIRNIVQLGAITRKDDGYELTEEGRYLVKLGVEPRLGKLICCCCNYGLGREGVVLAAVMANASSIFCRIGADADKLKSDRLKVRFCHRNGDLFTLLSVFKEWEAIPKERQNRWCVENSINAKSMRRCRDTVKEFEDCLAKDLNIRIPTNWRWDPSTSNQLDNYLKDVILSCLCENVAMYTGYDKLGYEVALTGQHLLLHPSCSLLAFGEKPQWVVFGEILSTSHPYLVCVTAFDFESLFMLCPSPLFDVSGMKSRKMEVKVITGFGSMLLKKFCGKFNSNLLSLVSRVRAECNDDRIGIQVDVNQNEVSIFAGLKDIGKLCNLVHSYLECEKRWLSNECMERNLYHGPGVGAPVALFGAGAVIKHLELKRRYIAVDIIHPNLDAIDDKELLLLLEKKTQSSICSVHKFAAGGSGNEDSNRWGRVTFLTPDAARQATELSEVEIGGAMLKMLPSRSAFGSDSKFFTFPGVKAKVFWPRRRSRGFGILKCCKCDMDTLIRDFSNVIIGGKFIRCEVGRKDTDSLLISGLCKDLTEAEILDVLSHATNRKILDFFLVRGDPVEAPAVSTLEEVLLREITPFMSQNDPRTCHCRVHIFPPEPKDVSVKAFITFDGRLHLEAAKALEHIDGKVLPGCQPWQKIRCERLFHSSLTCSASVYSVIKDELNLTLGRFKYRKGVEYIIENFNGSHRVKISATATRIVAELRRPVEQLMRGKIIDNASLSPAVFQQLFSRDGMTLMKSLQRETGTYILFDRHNMNVRVFGSSGKVAVAEKKLVDSLIELHESKQLEIQLRRRDLPSDMMKEVVRIFGPDLQGLKEKVPRAEFSLNTRRHVISVKGNRDMKLQVEEIVYDIAKKRGFSERLDEETEAACPICLCEVEDAYQLEACAHKCCRSCLLEQCDSAIKNKDSFPICCAYKGCGSPILVADLRSLLILEKLDELFRASIGAFVASSGGRYRFCPSPDCPSVYEVADEGTNGEPYVCGACYAETCTRCHMEYHPYLSCEEYREFKKDPDKSLFEWCKGKEDVKCCPVCAHVIEKIDGCNHVECRCGKHICWVCLEVFRTSDLCYGHLRSIHMAII